METKLKELSPVLYRAQTLKSFNNLLDERAKFASRDFSFFVSAI